ncbi:tellurite resistance TerB family protein [Oceanomicrobium pacificus]|uniref:TerB family tellurite resistance protein n=1 Tax=Oceanomicrobium pacificus TaxID=2692916 RepID=A0A6B0TN10_9RHOB|nr:TerB family tellurite resistance protein [Oceanomicrobium pacificus]MXU65980.1 TerB family tellurite resistance protein [Oceanomicrobium pacificus]
MIESLLSRLFGDPSTETMPAEDCRLALAALLVRAARADDDYALVEAETIDRVLAERYGLDAAAAAALRAEAEEAEAKAPDTVRFTRVIKDAVPYEERDKVAEALWRVVLADDSRGSDENGFLRLVVSLIGVSDVDSGLARQRAMQSD